MISRLYLDNCFTHQDRTFTFENGLTGIVGKNESGKSLIVEMIRYALFGAKALRGSAPDYKKLHVELDFVVKGMTYSVVRKGSKHTLEGPGHNVNGTKPVNNAITELLGYDLKVFDVANACTQGRVRALTEMSPTERRTMVDKTIGLDVLDDLISWCGTEGNSSVRQAMGMEAVLVEPVEPDPYSGPTAAEITPQLAQAREQEREAISLQAKVSAAPPEPTPPVAIDVQETVEELEQHQAKLQAQADRAQTLSRILNSTAAETHTQAEIDAAIAQNEMAARWKQKKRLLDQGEHVCPSCNHHWPVAGEDLEAFADVVETVSSDLNISAARALLGNDKIRKDAADELIAIVPLQDRSEDLNTVRRYLSQKVSYEAALESYRKFHEDLPAVHQRLEELKGRPDPEVLQSQLAVAQNHERATAAYEKAVETYASNAEQCQQLRARGEGLLEARDRIKDLKIGIKNNLIPSLNLAASSLLEQMTGGERSSVFVDEEFNILVDGQKVETLSGSGETVTNLAIRIALGQMLTNRVFSVFMADEIDGDMDDERARYTAEVLQRLSGKVKQIIQVTHKSPNTQHLIELSK